MSALYCKAWMMREYFIFFFCASCRSLLMAELEKEEKEKDWYYAQLQNLTKRIDSLPLTENVSFSFSPNKY